MTLLMPGQSPPQVTIPQRSVRRVEEDAIPRSGELEGRRARLVARLARLVRHPVVEQHPFGLAHGVRAPPGPAAPSAANRDDRRRAS